jgi:hypothetical protein
VDIAKRFDHIPFGMNAGSRITGPTAAATIVIGGIGNNLATLNQHSPVKASVVLLAQIHCAGIVKKSLKDGHLCKVQIRHRRRKSLAHF